MKKLIKMNKFPKILIKWKQEIIWTVIGFFGGQIYGTLFIQLTLNIGWDISAGIGMAFALLGAVLGLAIKFSLTVPKEIETTLKKRMDQIIEFTALGTKNGYWEKHLEKFKNTDLGDLKWAVAKFISFKLNKHFNDVNRIEINNVSATEYSSLLAELIKECSKSIYFTCPYTPSEWLKELIKDPCGRCENPPNCPPDKEYLLLKEHLPEHIRIFCTSKVKEKVRIVNIPEDKLLILRRDRCFKNFINYYDNSKEINLEEVHNIKIRLVKQQDIESSIRDLKDDDYNILDKKLIMKWDAYIKELNECPLTSDVSCIFKTSGQCEITNLSECPLKDLGKCVLIFDKGEIEKHLKIFENINASHYKKVTNEWPQNP